MLSINSCVRSGVLVCLLMSISGCGGPDLPYEVVPLEGTVTYQGEPLEGVTVHFRPTEGRESSAISEEGGKFVMRYTHDVDGVQKGTGKFYLTMPEQMGSLASAQGSQVRPQGELRSPALTLGIVTHGNPVWAAVRRSAGGATLGGWCPAHRQASHAPVPGEAGAPPTQRT